jgi:hypothetical protein
MQTSAQRRNICLPSTCFNQYLFLAYQHLFLACQYLFLARQHLFLARQYLFLARQYLFLARLPHGLLLLLLLPT